MTWSEPLTYLKGIIAAVGGNVFPPIVSWLVGMIPGNPPSSVQDALSILLVALLTGGAVVAVPNSQSRAQQAQAAATRAMLEQQGRTASSLGLPPRV